MARPTAIFLPAAVAILLFCSCLHSACGQSEPSIRPPRKAGVEPAAGSENLPTETDEPVMPSQPVPEPEPEPEPMPENVPVPVPMPMPDNEPVPEPESELEQGEPIWKVLEENDASIMSELMKKNGLSAILDNNTSPPVTIFAPTDSALEKMANELGLTSVQDLAASPGIYRALLNHLTQVFPSSDLLDGMALVPAAGRPLMVRFLNDTVPSIEGASVLAADLPSGLNIIHIVDRVLLSADELRSLINVDPEVCQCMPFGNFGCVGTGCDDSSETCCPLS